MPIFWALSALHEKLVGEAFSSATNYYTGVIPVSYTHLDVYKRQPDPNPHTARDKPSNEIRKIDYSVT